MSPMGKEVEFGPGGEEENWDPPFGLISTLGKEAGQGERGKGFPLFGT